MSTPENIINKIKKCLKLAASSNEHEAAAALRQAQKLMQAHGVSDLDIQAAEAAEARARAGAVKSPANWEVCLAGRIADAFACKILFTCSWNKVGEWAFIGIDAAPQVAEYAFRVLFRQARRARAEHIKTRLKRCKPGTKTRRADLYCQGWVESATALIDVFVDGPTRAQAVDAYMTRKYPSVRTLQSRDRNADRNLRLNEVMDYTAGHAAGRNAQLNRGLGGSATPRALEEHLNPA